MLQYEPIFLNIASPKCLRISIASTHITRLFHPIYCFGVWWPRWPINPLSSDEMPRLFQAVNGTAENGMTPSNTCCQYTTNITILWTHTEKYVYTLWPISIILSFGFNDNGSNAEVCEWMNNSIPMFMMDVFTNPQCDMLLNAARGTTRLCWHRRQRYQRTI